MQTNLMIMDCIIIIMMSEKNLVESGHSSHQNLHNSDLQEIKPHSTIPLSHEKLSNWQRTDFLIIFSNVLFILGLCLTISVHLAYATVLVLGWILNLAGLSLQFYKYSRMSKKYINEAMVAASKEKDIRYHFGNANDPANIRLQFTSFVADEDGDIFMDAEDVPVEMADESRPFTMEGPSIQKTVEVVYDYKARFEGKEVCQQLMEKFEEYKKNRSGHFGFNIRMTFANEIVDSQLIGWAFCVRVLFCFVPVAMFYIIFTNLFLREKWIFRIRKRITKL